MEQHPTPYPGKHRRIGAAVSKGKSEVKGSKETNIVPARYREKRTFGTIRSTNVAVEKPQLNQKPVADNVGKSARHPLVSVKLAVKNDTSKLDSLKVTGDTNMGSSNKAKIENFNLLKVTDVAEKGPSNKINTDRRKAVVSFQEPLLSQKSSKNTYGDDVQCTPLSAVKSAVLFGTPYYSAKNCSKCHLDKLETASYWLSQIKLAESLGKHFVSASFFRLAFECHAEPCRRLKNELKGYMERHVPGADFWISVCELYGLPSDRHPADPTVHDGVSSVQRIHDHSTLNMENEQKSLDLTDIPHHVDGTPEMKESAHNKADEGKSLHSGCAPAPEDHTGCVALMDASSYEANNHGSPKNYSERLPSHDMQCQDASSND